MRCLRRLSVSLEGILVAHVMYGMVVAAVWAGAASWAFAAPIRDTGREHADPAGVGEERFQSGFLSQGVHLLNPSRAGSARPDGSGTALTRLQGYLVDWMTGQHSQFLADLLFLSDREGAALKPVTFDYLLGGAIRKGSLKLQLGRSEVLSLDQHGSGSKYWDVRAGYLFGAPPAGLGLPGKPRMVQGWSGAWSVGYFFHNRDTPARGDRTGRAFLRYAGFLEGVFWDGTLLMRGDADFWTDKDYRRFSPADLDLSIGIGVRLRELDLVLYRKSRESLDRPGYAAYYLLAVEERFDTRAIWRE